MMLHCPALCPQRLEVHLLMLWLMQNLPEQTDQNFHFPIPDSDKPKSFHRREDDNPLSC